MSISKTYYLSSVLLFGKYKGKTINWVLEKDCSYLRWCLDEVEGFKLTKRAMDKLQPALEEYDDDLFDYQASCYGIEPF